MTADRPFGIIASMDVRAPVDTTAGTVSTVTAVHGAIRDATGLDLPVRTADGTNLGPADAPFRVVLNQPWSLRSVLLPATDRAAGTAYVYGDIDVEGDLIAALTSISKARDLPVPRATRLRLLRLLLRLPRPPSRTNDRRARLLGRIHSPNRDRQAIAFHYDLGNDFYRLFLDEDLVYSCAYFLRADEGLEAAQRRKLDLVCRKLRLQPEQRLLDIGCGWGSLVLHAARHFGVRAVGVTLSRQQAELATERVRAAGLDDRVEIRLADYREVEDQFDAVASVGMFEHVGPDHYPEYFGRCHALTAPGGRFLNHGITTGTRNVVVDMARARRRTFIGTYVFPDGGLAPSWQAVRHTEAAGFEVVDVEQLRPHYALTLRNWVERLEANHDDAVRAASEVDYRIWRAYMAGSVVGFETGDLGVAQVLGFKGAEVPLGRRWALPQDA